MSFLSFSFSVIGPSAIQPRSFKYIRAPPRCKAAKCMCVWEGVWDDVSVWEVDRKFEVSGCAKLAKVFRSSFYRALRGFKNV